MNTTKYTVKTLEAADMRGVNLSVDEREQIQEYYEARMECMNCHEIVDKLNSKQGWMSVCLECKRRCP